MKIYDLHVHSDMGNPNPKELIERMEEAGVYGGSVFSAAPEFGHVEKRLESVLKWTDGYKGRLFPILFVNPLEPDAMKTVEFAAKLGIRGYKMICENYYVYDEKSIELMKLMASFDKPIIFHSGILWRGKMTSGYNRPVNWECMLDIPTKFSMGHCSWPWVDECIALYGKILNAYTKFPDKMPEMFFDTTPGTPKIYRKELFYKLFNVGYDVAHNICWGSDCRAATYKSEWIKDWLEFDKNIFDELEIDDSVREMFYSKNYLRFIGEIKDDYIPVSPTADEIQNAGVMKRK